MSSIADQNMTVASIFSGCGGLDVGFKRSGFEIVFAADHDKSAVAAYTGNLEHKSQLVDVRDLEFETGLREVGTCDVLLGGFPCQGFSKAGPKRQYDERNSLYRAMIRAIRIVKPKIFIAENVDGLAQNYSGDVLRQIINDCSSEGYRVDWRIIDAAWFGVPQHRRRIIIVGIRKDLDRSFQWPEATHSWSTRNGERAIHQAYENWAENLKNPITLGEAISDIPVDAPDHDVNLPITSKTSSILARIPEGKKLCNSRHDSTSVRTWDIPEAFGEVTPRERSLLEALARNRRHKIYGSIPNGNPLSLDDLRSVYDSNLQRQELESLVRRGFLKSVGEKWDIRGAMFASGSYKKPVRNKPSPTVLTVFGTPRYFAHPTELRPFTVREASRLQSFSDDYQFGYYGVSSEDAFRLIGNAVPPVLSKLLAQSTVETLRGLDVINSTTLRSDQNVVASN